MDELDDKAGWKVTLKDWTSGATREEVWGAVVVCNGWYDHPVWPDTEGLEELKTNGQAMHAKWWRGPQGYENKARGFIDRLFGRILTSWSLQRVLVIGNANSSNDIAAQLAPLATVPVYRSVRRRAFPGFPSLPDPRIIDVAPVSRYSLSPSQKVHVELTDGTSIEGIDKVLVGSGYRPYAGFVHVLDPREKEGEENAKHETENNKERSLIPFMSLAPTDLPPLIPALHRHILYAHNPTLAFIGASLMSYTPFTVNDVASTWLALAWSSPTAMYPPTPSALLQFEKTRLGQIQELRQNTANPSSLMIYSVLGVYEEEYCSDLRREVVGVRPDLDAVLPTWSPERKSLREGMYAKKLESLRVAKEREERGGSTQEPIASNKVSSPTSHAASRL